MQTPRFILYFSLGAILKASVFNSFHENTQRKHPQTGNILCLHYTPSNILHAAIFALYKKYIYYSKIFISLQVMTNEYQIRKGRFLFKLPRRVASGFQNDDDNWYSPEDEWKLLFRDFRSFYVCAVIARTVPRDLIEILFVYVHVNWKHDEEFDVQFVNEVFAFDEKQYWVKKNPHRTFWNKIFEVNRLTRAADAHGYRHIESIWRQLAIPAWSLSYMGVWYLGVPPPCTASDHTSLPLMIAWSCDHSNSDKRDRGRAHGHRPHLGTFGHILGHAPCISADSG